MLLTSIGTCKNTGSSLGETSVMIGVNILHTLIDEIDLVASIKSLARQTMNALGVGMRWGKCQEETYFL